jgi:hypothetical protein
MSQYLLSVYYVEGEETPSDATTTQMYADVETLNQKIRDAGVWVYANGVTTPDMATVVNSKDGEVLVTDGPFPEAKEQIGGFWIIEAADLDEAMDWAAKASEACLAPVEIRPFQDTPGT